ncbi:uncharacterized protein LOC143349965 [Colletes latitarsis]|uniref:uncharacterized protein LOC143349965 n=1 Tax=Colletes latitarsis TaxID=2605962 RepID=UPI0040355A23
MSRINSIWNPCQYGPTEFRIEPTPVIPLPSNHVLLYCFCPCGRHRSHFIAHRDVILTQMGRNQSMVWQIRTQQQLYRIPERQLQARFRRSDSYKDHRQIIQMDEEEEIDR